MNLQSRNLLLQVPPLQGDDVNLLQHELQQLGFALLPDELAQATFGPGTRDAVQKFQAKFATKLRAAGWDGQVGIVEAITAQIINREVQRLNSTANGFTVRGQVRQADGKPLPGVSVSAFDRDLRSEQPLGNATTDAEGRYEIHYTAEQFRRAEKAAADLIFRLSKDGVALTNFTVADESGVSLETLSIRDATGNATSIQIKFNAAPKQVVNFQLSDSTGLPSEYERLVQELLPLLDEIDVPGAPTPSPVAKLALLQPEDIDFLSKETSINRQRIEFLAVAARLQQQATTPDGTVPAEAFYGLAREGLPTNLATLGTRGQKERSDAIEQALKDNIIPDALRTTLPNILERLDRLSVAQALQTPPTEGQPIPGQVLNLGLPTPDLQAAFLTRYANRGDQPIPGFWKELRNQPEFASHVDALQLNLQLGVLTQNHVPLMQALTANHGVTSTRDLVKLNTAAWSNLINTPQANGQVIGLPPGVDIAGDTPEEKTKNYVNGLVSVVQTAFPTETVAQLIAGAPAAAIHIDEPIQQGVTRFFANSPDFDLRSTRVESYVTEHAATAFDGVAAGDEAEVTNQVKRVQRLFQVSTKSETMAGLLHTGLHSAHAIANMPRSSFVTKHKDLLGGEDQANDVYERASAVNARNLHVWMTMYEAQYEPQTLAYGRDAENVRDLLIRRRLPNYKELFGAPELCDCQHCSSAYSPAAYLVDLLEFLRHCTPNSKGKTPRDVLLGDGTDGQIPGRRPDIAHIPLSCENTDTPLPYVDLVNEVLEFYVKNNKLDGDAAQDTGDASAEELNAAPQHTIPEAYDTLKQAVYPLTLPYNQPLEVARVYLNHLGTSLDELMRTFQSGTQPSDDDIACEALRISREKRAVIVGTDPHPLVDFFYDPAHRPAGSLAAELTKVREFLKQTGIEYVDLVELLKTRFLNPNQGTSQGLALDTPASIPNPNDSTRPILISPCDLDRTTIRNLDDPTLNRMHRFIRLWRKLGWTIASIDSALTALRASDIDTAFLTKLAQIKQLQAVLDVSNVQVLLSLWADIETRGDNALYKKLFLNRSAQIDDAFKPRNDGSVLTDAAVKLADHASVIRSALRVSNTDFAAIRADAQLLDPPAPNPPTVVLNLGNVSGLYRYAALAHVLKVRILDLIALKALCGINPFSAPDQTLRFVEILGKQRRSRFGIAQLDYLYRHRSEPPAGVAPLRNTVLSTAQTLHDGLLRIDADNQIADDPRGDLTRLKLGAMFEPVIVDQVIRMIDGTAIYGVALKTVPSTLQFPAALEHKISLDRPAKALRFAGAMTSAELASLQGLSIDQAVADLHRQPRDLINDALSGFLNPSQAVTVLLETSSLRQDGTPDGPLIADKFKFLLERLLPFVLERQSHSLIKQTLGDTLKLDGEIIELLLERLLKSRTDPAQAAINDALALRTTGLSAAVFNTANLTGPPVTRTDAALAFDGNAIGPAAIPAGAGSIRWTAFFLSPDNAALTLHVSASGDVKLWLGEDALPIIDVTLSQALSGASSQPQALKAGQLYQLRLEVRNLQVPQGARSAVAELRWSNASLAKDIVPSANLYSTAVVDVFVDAFTLLHKAALLASTFKLSQREVAYMAAHAADFAGVDPGNVQRTAPFDLNALPMKPADFNPAHFNQWERLFDLTALRDSLPQGDVTLIDVFAAASQANAQLASVTTTLVQTTGWDDVVVDALVRTTFNLAPTDLQDERSLIRLQRCMQLAKRIGVGAELLRMWASASTSDQTSGRGEIRSRELARHCEASERYPA